MDNKIARFPALTISGAVGSTSNMMGGDNRQKFRPKKEKSWVKYFLDLPGNDFMVEVDESIKSQSWKLTNKKLGNLCSTTRFAGGERVHA